MRFRKPGAARRWILILVGVSVAVLAVFAYRRWFRDVKPASAMRYSVAQVGRGNVTRSVMTTGQLAALVAVEVSTQISGQITEVRVDFNTQVKKGEVLATIDPATFQQKLTQAKADLAAAEASRELARLKSERQKQLLDRQFVTLQEYDESQAQLQQAEAVLQTRRAAVENAQLDLDRCVLTSPIDGIVIFKAADPGKTVQASFSAPTLFVIAQDLKRMQIIAAVSEVDIARVKPGQAVTFSVEAFPGEIFRGRVRQLRNPYTPSDKQSGAGTASAGAITMFDAVIDVENHDLRLLPSLTANVSIIVEERSNVLRVPNSALRVQIPADPAAPVAAPSAGSGGSVVYRLPGGDRTAAPETVRVRLGLTDSIYTEVVEGLAEGSVVITGVTRAPGPARGIRMF